MMATPIRRRSSRPRFDPGLLSFIAAALLLIAAVAFLVNRIGDLASNHGAQQTRASSTSLAMAKCNDTQAVADLLISQGFQPGDFTVGQDKFDLSLPAAKQVGADSFSKQPLTTREALVAFLKSDDPAAKAAKADVSSEGSATDAQILDVNNWQGFQLLVPVVWPGNTIFVGGQEKPAGELNAPAGDVGWVFINPNDCVKAGSKPHHIAMLRMGCTNPQGVLPRPVPMSTPTPTPSPICTPGTHPSPQQPTVCVAPKVGSQDVGVNPNVPGNVQGPGTSIGGNPPPAAPPTDSPTGCNGPCPGSSTPTPRPTSPIGPPPTPQPVPSPLASDPPQSTPQPTPPPPS